jgi:hypothetical protein
VSALPTAECEPVFYDTAARAGEQQCAAVLDVNSGKADDGQQAIPDASGSAAKHLYGVSVTYFHGVTLGLGE